VIGTLWSSIYLAFLFTWLAGRPRFWRDFGTTPPDWLHTVSAELHPFIPYLVVANLAVSVWGEPFTDQPVYYFIAGLGLVNWFLDRDDDDRWKRRRRKAAGAVKRVGARLVVAPAGAR
jgi:hypothetical protein